MNQPQQTPSQSIQPNVTEKPTHEASNKFLALRYILALVSLMLVLGTVIFWQHIYVEVAATLISQDTKRRLEAWNELLDWRPDLGNQIVVKIATRTNLDFCDRVNAVKFFNDRFFDRFHGSFDDKDYEQDYATSHIALLNKLKLQFEFSDRRGREAIELYCIAARIAYSTDADRAPRILFRQQYDISSLELPPIWRVNDKQLQLELSSLTSETIPLRNSTNARQTKSPISESARSIRHETSPDEYGYKYVMLGLSKSAISRSCQHLKDFPQSSLLLEKLTSASLFEFYAQYCYSNSREFVSLRKFHGGRPDFAQLKILRDFVQSHSQKTAVTTQCGLKLLKLLSYCSERQLNPILEVIFYACQQREALRSFMSENFVEIDRIVKLRLKKQLSQVTKQRCHMLIACFKGSARDLKLALLTTQENVNSQTFQAGIEARFEIDSCKHLDSKYRHLRLSEFTWPTVLDLSVVRVSGDQAAKVYPLLIDQQRNSAAVLASVGYLMLKSTNTVSAKDYDSYCQAVLKLKVSEFSTAWLYAYSVGLVDGHKLQDLNRKLALHSQCEFVLEQVAKLKPVFSEKQ